MINRLMKIIAIKCSSRQPQFLGGTKNNFRGGRTTAYRKMHMHIVKC